MAKKKQFSKVAMTLVSDAAADCRTRKPGPIALRLQDKLEMKYNYDLDAVYAYLKKLGINKLSDIEECLRQDAEQYKTNSEGGAVKWKLLP